MESAFRADFAEIRIHHDAEAARVAADVHARALTVGNHIVFGEGEYRPDSTAGEWLLAHELAHTIQQAGGPPVVQRAPADGAGADEGIPFDPGLPEDELVSVPWKGSSRESKLSAIRSAFRPSGDDQGRIARIIEIIDAHSAKGVLRNPRTGELIDESEFVEGYDWYVLSPGFINEVYELAGYDSAYELAKALTEGEAQHGRTAWGDGSGRDEADVSGSDEGPLPPSEREVVRLPSVDEGVNAPEVAEADELLHGNADWSRLSDQEKRLLIEYARMTPDEVRDGTDDIDRVSTSMKIAMALKLSIVHWPEEVGEAAWSAFTDWKFVAMLVATMGVYAGLWMVPEPSAITKVAAGTLTAVMLAQFAWHDIVGTAVAWWEFMGECARAKTAAQLDEAGKKLAMQMGTVGFDVLLMAGTWGLGKVAEPRLRAYGADRAVAAAEQRVAAAEQARGGRRSKANASEVLDEARATSPSTDPAAILDAYAAIVPDTVAAGLRKLRSQRGDLKALQQLESMTKGGTDIEHHLAVKGRSKAETAAANEQLAAARAKLARAKALQKGVHLDPQLRQQIRWEWLKENTPVPIRRALSALGRAARTGPLSRLKSLAKQADIDALAGEIGETLARIELRRDLDSVGADRVWDHPLEILEEIPGGHKTIEEWKQADLAAGGEGRTAALYEADGKLWKSVGEIDVVATKSGKSGHRPKVVQEVKTGNDTAAKARKQLARAMEGLKGAAEGRYRIFEKRGKKTVDKDVTSQLDLSALDEVKQVVRGVREGFDQPLGLTRAELEHIARFLIENGLPFEPELVPPLPDRDRSRESTESP